MMSLYPLILAVTLQDNPVEYQVVPPFVDLRTPIDLVSPASPSPVKIQMVLGVEGWITIPETPIAGRPSE
jgi:hypothetical protein